MSNSSTRLIVVSNRLPVSLVRDDERGYRVKPSSGGLVTALAPALRDRGGLWIGWPGQSGAADVEPHLKGFSREAGYELHAVDLTDQDIQDYYQGFANEIIWPLFHDLQTRCNFAPEYWTRYLAVNDKFAEAVMRHADKSDYIWVHDYHLMHVAQALAERGAGIKSGFFLHIPFPPPDIFLKLPWRHEVLTALLSYGLVGFQTLRDRRNFIDCAETLLTDAKVTGRGSVVRMRWQGREIRLGSFPISIDYAMFAKLAGSTRTTSRAREIRQAMGVDKLILGVDRLDYTKGVPERLQAFKRALLATPSLKRRVSFVQVVVPSRVEVPQYQALKVEIERLVSEINGVSTWPGWVPIHYHFRSLSREELVAYYRAADIALVTPLKDGMNLVAKEYCASRVDEDGILLLSEFAGAAAQLQRKGVVLVNPNHVESVAQAMVEAVDMDPAEQKRRMRRLRETIRRQNIFWWVDSFLRAAFSRSLGDFAPLESVDFSAFYQECDEFGC